MKSTSRSDARRPSMTQRARRNWLRMAAALLASGAGSGRLAAAGAVAVRDEDWADEVRRRRLPLRLRLPQGAGPHPVLLFSHGLGGSRDAGTWWGEAWAAAGYAVVHLQHPGSDTAAVLEQGMRGAMQPEQLLARTQDVRFVIDELTRRKAAGRPEYQSLKLDAIGLAGHSFGARTVFALAGERFPVVEQLPPEPRIRAFIAFSPSSAAQARRQPLAEVFGQVRGPLLCVTGTLDGDVVGIGETPFSRQQPFDHLPPGDKYLWVLQDADHMTFGGQAFVERFIVARGRAQAARDGQSRHRRLIERVTTRFWDAYLSQDVAAQAELKQPDGLAPGDVWRAK
jgi:predicted dienelactone hydrolase